MKDAEEIADQLGTLLVPHPGDLARVADSPITSFVAGSLRAGSDKLIASPEATVPGNSIAEIMNAPDVDEEVRRMGIGALDSGVVAVGVVGGAGVGVASGAGAGVGDWAGETEPNPTIRVGFRSTSDARSRRLMNDLVRQFGAEIDFYTTQPAQVHHAVGPLPCSPVHPGSAISATKKTYGSLGAVVVDESGAHGFISNAHVLNQRRGDVVWQPGPDKTPTAQIGRTRQVVAPAIHQVNTFDAGVGFFDDGVEFSAVPPDALSGFGTPAPASSDDAVVKYGASSGLTEGVLDQFGTRVAVWYGRKRMVFARQYQIRAVGGRPFSVPGDSGSLVCLQDGLRPFGLLFAGNAEYSWASPVEAALVSFGVNVA